MPALTTLAFAKLLDLALGKAFDLGVESLKGAASAQLQSAAKELNKEQAGRDQRMAAIVQNAAEIALPELRDLDAQTGKTYAAVLEHQPFLEAVIEQLLLGGRPDMARLRGFVEETVGPEAWQQMGRPLLNFVTEIDRQLGQDRLWAAPLAEFRTEAQMAGLDRNLLRIAEATEAALGALARNLPQAIAGELARRQGLPDLDALERAYLSGLYAECNKLPLADDTSPDVAQDRRPRMQRVYVDFRVEAEPALTQVFDRLRLPVARRATLERALNQALSGEGQPGRGKEKLPDDLARRLREEIAPGLSRQLAAGRGHEKLNAALKEAEVTPEAFADALGRITVFEQLRDHRQLVLLGDPGSGKSTLTRRLAGMLAAGADPGLPPEESDWQTALAPACDRWLLPVRVTLSRWASQPPPAHPGTASDLIAECLRLIHQTANLPAGRFLDRLSSKPSTVLLLLDGLDEVSDAGQRKRLLAAVRDFCDGYAHVPLLITCRVRPYHEGDAYRLPLPIATLAPLDDDAIAAFLQRWHDELVWVGTYDSDAAQVSQHRLQEAIADAERGELREMAGTPLLLTMMARVNYKRGLPGSRAKLYEEYVRELLWEWEKKKQDDPGQPSDLEGPLRRAGVDPVSLNLALDRLAYQVHGQTGSRDTVDIPDMQVRKAIEAIHPGDAEAKAAWAVQVLRLMDARSGLLYARKEQEVYAFAHRTFQEYLAARHLAGDDYLHRFAAKIDDPNWREAVFLGLGYLIFERGAFGSVLSVLHELLPDRPQTETDWRRVLLLGEAYTRLLTPQRAREAEQQKVAAKVMESFPTCLTTAMQNPQLPARQRLEAGLLLADLEVDPPGLDDFVPIPGAAFSIGRYLVTNKQYKRFMDAGGYDQTKPWWTKKGIEELVSLWGAWPTEPRYWDNSRFNRPTQPVVGVSWYEANAYCAWLTAKLQNEGQQVEARLPTQAEWEHIAGTDKYPWGPDFIAAAANTEESNLNQTTPVHMYPDGKTQEGVWDLAGNVWEWTATRAGEVSLEAYRLMGGAYWNSKDRVGASARSRYDPYYWLVYHGFRVLVSPSSR